MSTSAAPGSSRGRATTRRPNRSSYSPASPSSSAELLEPQAHVVARLLVEDQRHEGDLEQRVDQVELERAHLEAHDDQHLREKGQHGDGDAEVPPVLLLLRDE